MSKYSDTIALIDQHLTELEALVASLPDPVGDLMVIDTRITALTGTLQAKVSMPAAPAP